MKHLRNGTFHDVSASAAGMKSERVPLHQFFDNRQRTSKSTAGSHHLEFLHRVFSAEGANRFFKTFLLRFLSDSNKSPDGSTGKPVFAL